MICVKKLDAEESPLFLQMLDDVRSEDDNKNISTPTTAFINWLISTSGAYKHLLNSNRE